MSLEITTKPGTYLSSSEIVSVIEKLEQEYGVDSNKVNVDIEYEVSGILQTIIPESMSDEEVQRIFKEVLGSLTGLSSQELNVLVDPVTKEISYFLTSENDDVIEQIVGILSNSNIVNVVNDEVNSFTSDVVVTDIKTNPATMDMTVTLDVTETTVLITETSSRVVKELEETGLIVKSDGKYILE